VTSDIQITVPSSTVNALQLTQLRRVGSIRCGSIKGTLWFGDDEHDPVLCSFERGDGVLVCDVLQVDFAFLQNKPLIIDGLDPIIRQICVGDLESFDSKRTRHIHGTAYSAVCNVNALISIYE
jgi:hypothetical protein